MKEARSHPELCQFHFKSPHRKELEEELRKYQVKGTEVDERAADLYSKQGLTDITELVVIDETTQCEKCKEHDAKRKVFLHMWSIFICGVFCILFTPSSSTTQDTTTLACVFGFVLLCCLP